MLDMSEVMPKVVRSIAAENLMLTDFFVSITTAEYGQQRFFQQDDGTWYDRSDGEYHTLEEILRCVEYEMTRKAYYDEDIPYGEYGKLTPFSRVRVKVKRKNTQVGCKTPHNCESCEGPDVFIVKLPTPIQSARKSYRNRGLYR